MLRFALTFVNMALAKFCALLVSFCILGGLVWYLFVCIMTPLMIEGKVRALRLLLLLLLRFEFG